MSDKKHIDRLFQESFKDFEATPSDAVWQNIETKLNQKKKKRHIIPIWWRYAGVAALLILLLTIDVNYLNNTDDTQQNQVVETENNTDEKTNINGNKPLDNADKIESIITDNNKSGETLNKSSETKLEARTNKITPSKESSIAENSSSKNKNESKTNLSSDKILNTNNNQLNQKNSSNNAFANQSEEKNSVIKLPNNSKSNHVIGASNEEKNNSSIKNETPLINKEKGKELINNTSKNTIIAELEKETPENVVDNKIQENALTIEEALDKNKDIIEETNQNRWSIAPNAAPVYFNTLGEGSSLDPQFNSNSKSGELNMSYGISASYAINNKLKVRSGINKVNLGYNTNDVIVFQSPGLSTNTSALQNVNGGRGSVSLISAESLNSDSPESLASSNSSINQALGYIEIPLEIQYTLSDKKLGINVIGGFSSFFLNNNEIFSEAENGNRTFLGEANNINTISYSANFGLGLNYQVSKKIDLNLEPIFKYQINTFKNTSGDFTPFFIGVYTGFAIKF